MIKKYIINKFNLKKLLLLSMLQIIVFLHAKINANENFTVPSYENNISNMMVSTTVFKYGRK